MLLADQHAGLRARGRVGEGSATAAGRHDVRAGVAQGDEPAVLVGDTGEATDPAPGDVLEKDPLHRVLGAVLEDLLARRLDEVRHRSDPAR